MNKTSFWLLAAGCLLFSLKSFSQNEKLDSTGILSENKEQETSNKKQVTISPNHSPRKAALYSAFLPGLGQAYNKKYWKMPIIYAGFGALGYLIYFNHSGFVKYRDEYIFRQNNNGQSQSEEFYYFTDGDLLTLKNYYRRNMEYSFVFTGLLYVLNIVDAYVDAHLMTFDMSDDLSMNIQPVLLFANKKENTAGLQLSVNF